MHKYGFHSRTQHEHNESLARHKATFLNAGRDGSIVFGEAMKEVHTGTTTVGIRGKDYVVLAADKRATMGYFVASKKAKKIIPITDNVALTIAGAVGDAQFIARLLRAEINYYKARSGQEPNVKQMAHYLNVILNSSRYFPYYVQFLLGGVVDESELYSIDLIGGITDEIYASTGSGSPLAYAIIEEGYKEGMSAEEAAALAKRAIETAMKRDVGTGEGVDVLIITKEGYKWL